MGQGNLLGEGKVNQTGFLSFMPSDPSAASKLCRQGHTSSDDLSVPGGKLAFTPFQPCYQLVSFPQPEQGAVDSKGLMLSADAFNVIFRVVEIL